MGLQGASLAEFGDEIAVSAAIDDVDSSKDVGVEDAHDGYLFHVEQVLGDFVVDGLGVDDLDCHVEVVLDGAGLEDLSGCAFAE